MTQFVCILTLFLLIVVESLHRSQMRSMASAVVTLGLAFPNPALALGESSLESGPARFTQALESLRTLDKDWGTAVKEPDDVRRVLGTVYTSAGCTKPLCGFESFVRNYAKSHVDELNDIEEYDTYFLEAQKALTSADFLAYSAVFSEYGNGGGGKDYVELSKVQVEKAIEALTQLNKVVNNP